MAGIKERLIQVILRGKDLLSPEANKSKKALDELRDSGEKLREELDKAKDDNNLVRSLSALEKESERTQKTADRTAAKVVELRDELNKNPDSKGLSQSLKDAEREAEKAQKALDALKVKTADMAEEAKKAGIDTSKLSDEEKRLAAELVKAKGAVTDNSKATSDLQKEQSAAARSAAEQADKNSRLRDVIGTVEKRVLTYAAAYISLKAAMSAVRGVTDFVVSGFKSVFTSASESEQVLAQLNAALASTEGAIGITADELQRMGLEMRKTSMLSTEQITEMQVALLTYTDIAKEEFPRALQVAIDQQQRLGISITQSAELVGKALQDPSKAMVALGRQGFKLEESQKTLLKQMEDTGRTAEAQAIIMDMLAESYGGSAAAARYNTFDGLWKGITDTFEDFKSKIAGSGSFDYLKDKLTEVSGVLTELEADGTLDKLAVAISDAFVAGAEKVEEFVRSLAGVDFKELINGSSEWLSDFGTKIDSAVEMADTAGRIFTGVWHGFRALVTGAATVLVSAVNTTLGNLMRGAAAVADAIGLDDLADKAKFAYGFLDDLQTAFADATIDSAGKVADAIEGSSQRAIDSKKAEQAEFDAAAIARKNELTLAQAYADQWVSAHKSVGDEARKAAVDGVRALEDMADALNVIDATDSVAELEKLRSALLKAYQEGRISQQEFEQGTGVLDGKLRELGTASATSSRDLKSLNGIMEAIAKSANNIDTRAAQVALDKLYKEGKIDAKEHAKAQEELNKKVAELKPAAEQSKKSVDEMGESLDEASGGLTVINNNVGRAAASFAWFMGMLDNVREPLEQMSESAVAAFNDLQGITNTPNIDTSSLSSVTDALQRVRDETGRLEMAMNSTFGANISDTLSRWAIQTKLNGKEVEMSYLAQKESLLSLMRTVDAGGLSLDYLASLAGEASSRFDLLSESDLSPLVAAANQAKEAMKAFSDSTQSTVDNLRMELLQLQGTEEEIAKARAEQRRNELKSQLAMAEKNNDKESIARLHEALGLLNKIESEQVNRIRTTAEEKAAEAQRKEQEAQQKEQDTAQREADNARKKLESEQQAKARELEKEKEAKTKTKEKDSAARPTVGQQYQPPAAGSPIVTRVIRIESRNGQGVDLGIRSASDEIQLLSVLEAAGLRSL